MTIQVDTREHDKEWQRIKKQFDKLGADYFRSKLWVGDYCNIDNPRVVIDRKKDLLELCGNVTQQHERFTRELTRAQDKGIKIIILCEHGEGIERLSDVYFWHNPRLDLTDWVMKDGKPVKILAEPDNTNWQANGMDLQHVRLTVVDSKGRRCLSYNDELDFSITGDASIVAVTNGDITTDEIATQPHVRLWQGQAMVILRSGRQASKITLTTKPKTFKDFITKLETK